MNTIEFLREKVYLPEFMTLTSIDYDKKEWVFNFNPNEPVVARRHIQPHYVTPRGIDLCIVQAGYSIAENLVNENLLGDLNLETLRQTLLEGRIRIIDIYEKFRKELNLREPIQGRFNISRLRLGKNPILKLDFGFANNTIRGFFTSIITENPNPQLNSYASRFKIKK